MTQQDTLLYQTRKMSAGFPDLGKMSPKDRKTRARDNAIEEARIGKITTHLERLVDFGSSDPVLVLGCGPYPRTAEFLAGRGNKVVAVEPVASFVDAARGYLAERAEVLQGAAEHIPLSDGSQRIVIFEAVLEHVDSVRASLEEIYRVLAPGGVAYITTTNRYRFSLTGKNGEYNAPFFNWYPRLVRESYVFKHLHYSPVLANHSSRPAVHWFTYDELCERGRDAGFAQFYSPLDLMRSDDAIIRKSRFRSMILPMIQRSAWIRAAALTQMGAAIFMLKRRGFDLAPEGVTR